MGNPAGVRQDFEKLEQRRLEAAELLRQGLHQLAGEAFSSFLHLRMRYEAAIPAPALYSSKKRTRFGHRWSTCIKLWRISRKADFIKLVDIACRP
jgi:hypothetical protein